MNSCLGLLSWTLVLHSCFELSSWTLVLDLKTIFGCVQVLFLSLLFVFSWSGSWSATAMSDLFVTFNPFQTRILISKSVTKQSRKWKSRGKMFLIGSKHEPNPPRDNAAGLESDEKREGELQRRRFYTPSSSSNWSLFPCLKTEWQISFGVDLWRITMKEWNDVSWKISCFPPPKTKQRWQFALHTAPSCWLCWLINPN